MISRQILKEEIDKVQESYLYVLYRIIKLFENPGWLRDLEMNKYKVKEKENDWYQFLKKYAGCLANDPIVRGEQGQFEVRETFD